MKLLLMSSRSCLINWHKTLHAFFVVVVNFNGNKERSMHTAEINLDRSRVAFGTLYLPHVTLKLRVGCFRF